MLDIDERRKASAFLSLGDGGEGKRRFARGFRTEDFDDSAAWEATDAEGPVDQQVAGRDHIHIAAAFIAEAHDGCFSEFLLDMGDRKVEVALAGVLELFLGGFFSSLFGHDVGG